MTDLVNYVSKCCDCEINRVVRVSNFYGFLGSLVCFTFGVARAIGLYSYFTVMFYLRSCGVTVNDLTFDFFSFLLLSDDEFELTQFSDEFDGVRFLKLCFFLISDGSFT